MSAGSQFSSIVTSTCSTSSWRRARSQIERGAVVIPRFMNFSPNHGDCRKQQKTKSTLFVWGIDFAVEM
jgi:hypothetical protein